MNKHIIQNVAVNFSPPCKWELKLTETSKGKRKSQWHYSSAVEEDKLKVMHYNILMCGVLIHMAFIIDSFTPGLWTKCKLSLDRHDIKTSQILSLSTVTVPKKLLLG